MNWSSRYESSRLRQCLPLSRQLLAGGAADLSVWVLLGGYTALALTARRALSAPFDASISPFAGGMVCGTAIARFALSLILAPAGPPPPFIYFQF